MNEDTVTASNENGKLASTLTTSLTPDKDACTNENTTPTMLLNNEQPAVGLIYFSASVHFYKSRKPTEVTATNAPNYTDDWKSPPFNHEG